MKWCEFKAIQDRERGLHDDGIEFVVNNGVSLVLTKVLRGRGCQSIVKNGTR